MAKVWVTLRNLLLVLLLVVGTATTLTGCEGDQDVGDEIDEALDETGDALEDAGDEAEEAL